MNFRPYPITTSPFPLLNTTASTPTEIQQNWAIINSYFQQANNQQQPQAPGKQGQPGRQGKPGQGGGGTGNVKPYDGNSPAHDTVPYVITNGVLVNWPGSTILIGKGSQLAMKIDVLNGVVYPNILVVPVFGP